MRQPLARLTVLTSDSDVTEAVLSHADVISEELNVKEVVASRDESSLVHLSAKANFRKLGPVLGNRMKEVAEGISALVPQDVERLISGETIEVAGTPVGIEDVLVERTPKAETMVEAGVDFSIALDTHISEELRLEGLARELTSRVQRMRREAGLAVTDRIVLAWWSEDPDLTAAVGVHKNQIAAEVLAVELTPSQAPLGQPFQIAGREVWLEVAPARSPEP